MALQEELKEQGDFLFKYRSYLPLLLVFIGIIIIIINPNNLNDDSFSLSNLLKQSAIFVGLFGLLIRAYTIGYTKKHTSGRNTGEGQVAEDLNTKGIYSLTRNPLYLGNYFMWLSLAMMVGSICFVILFTLIFWIYYERIVYAEEQFLRKKFGDKYLYWASKTPIFIPYKLKNYQKNICSYNWKDVLKRERNGLASLFILFFIFDLLSHYKKHQNFELEWNFINIGFILSIIIFIVVKTLQKKTNLLN